MDKFFTNAIKAIMYIGAIIFIVFVFIALISGCIALVRYVLGA